MEIGNRNLLILKDIIEYRDTITGKELENKFHLSRKQLSYGLGKINQFLSQHNYPEITRLTNGKMSVPSQLEGVLDQDWFEDEKQELWFSKEERVDIIRLMVLIAKEDLSLQHFISELKVSRNTVLTDLKKVDSELKSGGLILNYGRKTGYCVTGSEYAKRQMIFVVLNRILIQYRHSFLARKLCQISREKVQSMKNMILEIEGELQVRFAGEMIESNSCFFAVVFDRIQNGMVLDEIPDSFRHIAGTKEYTVMRMLANHRNVQNEFEIMYLTAHVQSMKVETMPMGRDADEALGIQEAVEETIQNYEQLSCVNIREREDLKKLLLHHCEPALYRIRYDFHVGLDITDYILPAYQDLHNLVRKSVAPLERLVGKKIPEKELAYISLIIGTYVTKEGQLEVGNARPEAVVVCQNGITVSRFLISSLKEMFPEIRFTKCMSAEQFGKFQESFDMVFSTIPLKTEKKLFVVEPLMNGKQRKTLRETVLKALREKGILISKQDLIMQLVRKHISPNLYNKLCMEIEAYTSPQAQEEFVEARGELHLKELLVGMNIRIVETKMGWKEAIEFAAMPLLYDGSITIRYVQAIISNIVENKPHLEVADGVIIAHAGIEQGVNDVGMSMLVLPERIEIDGYIQADVIVVLATPDYESHLLALNELIEILEDDVKVAKIKQAKTPHDILELL
ncbi:BglG family transcription antiterminator [Agathobaculum sp. LCP25S3_E8]|uniref:BglG family transcription antiterminator n=1 Tax=Agathobaculum sp. LCP25S3_E8 TaxID=3438735 RepID=UPI003F903A9E